MSWFLRKPFSSVRLASCKSLIGVLRFSFFFASFAVQAQVLAAPALNAYFVAPGGSDFAAGTQAAPFATLQKGHDVAVAGDTIYMRGGIYAVTAQIVLTRDGTSANPIEIFAYPGETPVIDAINQPSGTFAIIRMTSASSWHIKGLELKNGAVQGIHAEGASSNNIFEQLNIHHIGRAANGGGTGTALAIYGTGGNNLVLNNDVHDNDDALGSGGGANGINVVSTGTGNAVRGNRAWRNSDDGFDFWNSAPVLIANNWAWENGYTFTGGKFARRGNGMGFKLGGTAPNDGGHTVVNNLAWNNRVDGFHENGGDRPMTLYNNTAWSNGRQNYTFFHTTNTFRNNISFGAVGSPAGSNSYNSWNLPVTVSSADFASFDDTCAGPRKADGSLPDCPFLHLVAGSDLIDKGVNVGLPYSGAAPDLGAGNR